MSKWKHVDDQLAAIAARQWGLVTVDQARAVGITRYQVQHRAERGELERVHRGVYRLASATATFEHTTLAAVLYAGPLAFASHASACVLWGLPLDGRLDELWCVEVTTASTRRLRSDGVVWHRTGHVRRSDIVVARAVPCAPVERAIADVSARCTVEQLGALLDEALRRELTTPARFARHLNGLAPVRVRDLGRLRAALVAVAPQAA